MSSPATVGRPQDRLGQVVAHTSFSASRRYAENRPEQHHTAWTLALGGALVLE